MWNANEVKNQTIIEKEFGGGGITRRWTQAHSFKKAKYFTKNERKEKKKTQIFLKSELVSVLTCTRKMGETRTVLGDWINH